MYLPQSDVDFLRWIRDQLDIRLKLQSSASAARASLNAACILRLSELADQLEDPLDTLKPGDAVDVMDAHGGWHRAVFMRWVADGLGAEIEHERFKSVGRLAIRKVV